MFYLTLIFGKDWQSSVEMDLLWYTNKHAQILYVIIYRYKCLILVFEAVSSRSESFFICICVNKDADTIKLNKIVKACEFCKYVLFRSNIRSEFS